MKKEDDGARIRAKRVEDTSILARKQRKQVANLKLNVRVPWQRKAKKLSQGELEGVVAL
ncbi:uncharacterized protein DS421_4g122520 [Arachis hypogaea]|nr:uncharacterized protein DS421_4g122520 [Arachis hypogaea]